jgi:uncharacterized membrane protein HdeD (DUF308 family)
MDRGSGKPPVLVDVLNRLGFGFMIFVGILFLRDNLVEVQLPFLLVGLVLIVIGVLQIAYRVKTGKWFSVFG